MMVNMSASAAGLCDFIDASPSPFHVCATVAGRLLNAGYTELSEADRWPEQPGRFFTVRAGDYDEDTDMSPNGQWIAIGSERWIARVEAPPPLLPGGGS